MDEGGNTRPCNVLCGKTGLLLLMTIYAIFGAVIFKAIEGDGETSKENSAFVQKSREDCLKELWLITERLNVLYEKNWTRLVTAQLKRFEKAVVEAGKIEDSSKYSTSSSWSFGGALLYSITLLTTVGYSRLTPKTVMGKLITIVYAIFGVPLMLVLLSELGNFFAGGASKSYAKLCCKHKRNSRSKNDSHSSVEYHKAPTSPPPLPGNCYKNEDSTSIQVGMPNHHHHHHSNYTSSKHYSPHRFVEYHHEPHQELLQKRVVLATVKSGRTRAGFRQGAVRQMLVDPSLCPQHCHGPPIVKNCVFDTNADRDEAEDEGDNENGIMCSHDTPSRVPLIWKPPPEEQQNCENSENIENDYQTSVPTILVISIMASYICAGAAALVTVRGWNFLEAFYFCFLALTTIGVGDKLPSSSDLNTQLQMLACCMYLILGLVIIAMCFSLVQDEIVLRFRQVTGNVNNLK